MPVTASQLVVYDEVKEGVLKRGITEDGLGTQVAEGFVTGIKASVASNLMDMANMRVMNMKVDDYEGALDCAFKMIKREGFPTLDRWIQMQSNLHRILEVAVSTKSNNEDTSPNFKVNILVKCSCDPESDTELEEDDIGIRRNTPFPSLEFHTQCPYGFQPLHESPKLETAEVNTTTFLSFDWEIERPYEKAVERLINERKLVDALALSDCCLSSGASNQLFQLLIEHEEENNTISGHSNDQCNIASIS